MIRTKTELNLGLDVFEVLMKAAMKQDIYITRKHELMVFARIDQLVAEWIEATGMENEP
jgi:hypothetical protein